ncbi:MAG: hypothetical protein IPO67_11030 [Deltaproteobacteria bacterium]|nr:hypothetical protein [Deltaproteobacteria bacterium]MBK9645665.1 hypothetical protein [Deltaproteobacteria bacterium]
MHRRLSLIFWVWASLLAAPRAQAACSTATAQSELVMSLDLAERALLNLDAETFTSTLDRVMLSLDCLAEPADPTFVMRLHQLVGVRHFMAGDERLAALAFAAARQTVPEAPLPTSLAPEGHTMRGLYGLIPTDSAAVEALTPPRQGSYRVNGAPSVTRSAELPTLVQHLGADGGVLWTAYLYPNNPTPWVEPARRATPPDAAAAESPSRAPLIAAGSMALVSAGLYVGSQAARACFNDDGCGGPTQDDLTQTWTLHRALYVSAAAGGAVSLALGVTWALPLESR